MKKFTEKLNSLQHRRVSFKVHDTMWNDPVHRCNFRCLWKYNEKEHEWYVSVLEVQSFQENVVAKLDEDSSTIEFQTKDGIIINPLSSEYNREIRDIEKALEEFWGSDYDIITQAILTPPDKMHIPKSDDSIELFDFLK